MKIKNGYILRRFADKYIALSAEDAADNNNVLVTLNRSGAYAWGLMESDVNYDEVVKGLLEKYNASEETIKADLDEFLTILRNAELLDE